MLVLDTDTLTVIQRQEGDLYARLDARLQGVAATRPICVTVISLEEQLRGWLAFIARARSPAAQVPAYSRLRLLVQDFADRHILDFNEQAADLYQQLTRARVRIGTMDLKIAAIVLAHSATLLSRNLRDFQKVPGLQVEDWTVPAPG
jgi:tRNA(fMet)-specific endonuclease VapC